MNLLITGAWGNAKDNIGKIESMGHAVVFQQQERDTIVCGYEWVEGIVGNGIFQHHPIERFTNLKYIQLTSAGFDRIPMDYVKEHQIAIHNARGVYSIPMAEFAVSGVLQLYKQSRFFYDNQKEHRWEKHRGLLELSGKTVCVLGCGSVGTECARRFSAFGCKVVGIDAVPYESKVYEAMNPISEMIPMLAASDIVVLTLPLTDGTRHLMDKKRLAALKRGSVLVNISRGAVAGAEALIGALKENLLGAVVDVFEEEPLSGDSQLWDMENVIITPHNSFVGDGNGERLAEVILSNLRKRGK